MIMASDSENELYHSKLVTCVDDSDEDIDIGSYRVPHMDDEAYDLNVPNESWSTEFKSNLNYRPRPLGCSSDSPDSCTSSGLDNKEHYDSLEELEPDPEPVNVMVRHPFPAEIVVVQPQQGGGGGARAHGPAQQPPQQNSKQKRSLPPIPKDHSLQQQRAYEILRQQWQCTPSSSHDDSLEDLYHVHDRSRPHVEGRSADFSDYDLLDDLDHNNQHHHQNFNVNLTSKRQLPKPPPVSPIVLLNEDHQELEHQADSGCASLNNTEHDHSLQLVEELLPEDGGGDEKTCEIDEISRSTKRRRSKSSNNNNEKRNLRVEEVEKEEENLELQTRHRNNHLEHPSTSSK